MPKITVVTLATVSLLFSASLVAGFTPSSSSCDGIEKRIRLIEKALRGGTTLIQEQELEAELLSLKQQKDECENTDHLVAQKNN